MNSEGTPPPELYETYDWYRPADILSVTFLLETFLKADDFLAPFPPLNPSLA